MVAAGAGSGPQFEELDATLRAAQTRRRKLWHALDDLGARADIVPLRELAAAVDLAAESGSRIRETLLAKANALRVRQLTEAEADAQKASETMGIAPALMADRRRRAHRLPRRGEVLRAMTTTTTTTNQQGANRPCPSRSRSSPPFLVLRDRVRRTRSAPSATTSGASSPAT